MSESPFLQRLRDRLGERVACYRHGLDVPVLEIAPEHWLEVARILRDDPEFAFAQLIDLCGVDYLGYGSSEWDVGSATGEGFSRGVEGLGPGRFRWEERPAGTEIPKRFAVVVQLLSLQHNRRLRLRCHAPDDELPVVPSLTSIWPVANWYEREAFDLFGIVFEGHPDLRRILTDYGFIGHPFRKDFPLIGTVEVRYDPEKGRVIYEPVSIEPRVNVPRVVRRDSRYEQARVEEHLAREGDKR
ncbi:MAG: NADH-quinone oxidoreductase subunit C [Lysobacterales bacterium]|jgi:NADH-quinone oxidoreductase subunit C|nr:MAG: NADH-quinone oxidoreductase subunit C [Xanthomonadales bacterium]